MGTLKHLSPQREKHVPGEGKGLRGGMGSQVLGLLPDSKEDEVEVRPRKAETGHPVWLLGQSCVIEL